MSLCEFLPWDSDFFGMPIARLMRTRLDKNTAEDALRWCHAQRIHCLYFLADADDPLTVITAENYHFRLVDIRLTLEHSLAETVTHKQVIAGLLLRPSTPVDLPALMSFTRNSFTLTRFYFDRRFPRERCDALYSTWLENSFNGYADQVIVSEVDGQPAGFITCKIRRNEHENTTVGEIGLTGIAPEVRGAGIGIALVEEALRWFAGAGAEQVRVVTQGRNLAAQRLYQRCGFLSKSVHLWYHRWMDNEETT